MELLNLSNLILQFTTGTASSRNDTDNNPSSSRRPTTAYGALKPTAPFRPTQTNDCRSRPQNFFVNREKFQHLVNTFNAKDQL